MKAACVLVLLAAVCVLGNTDASTDLNLDEIENIDASVFKPEDPRLPVAIDQASSPLSVSARDADLDTDTEAVAALATDAGVATDAHVTSIGDTAGVSASDASALFSFRAMRHASALAGESLTETSAQTHAAAMRVLKSKDVSADDMFAEINREQQILVAKRALVARQRQSIADSVESLARLKQLIDENKRILRKNEKALRRGSDDLLRLISHYQAKLKAGLTKEIGAASDSTVGEPLRSRPHQPAAYVKVDQKGVPRVDTTKSKAQVKAVKAAAAVAPGTKPVAAAKPAKAKAAPKAAAKAAPKAAAKAKFAQVHGDSEESEEAESESEAEDEEEEEESEESEDSEEEEEEESDSSEEESEESLLETKAKTEEEEMDSYDPLSVSHEAILPGLAPPPKVYDPEADRFI